MRHARTEGAEVEEVHEVGFELAPTEVSGNVNPHHATSF